MLYKNAKKGKVVNKFGVTGNTATYDLVLFKDKDDINHRNLDDYLANIHLLADEIKKGQGVFGGTHPLLDVSFMSNKKHKPNHTKCSPFGVNNNVTRVVEKRMCKCMYYYNSPYKDAAMCKKCKLDFKWKNVGKIQIANCEVPTTDVIKSVGGIDLIFQEYGNEYSVEVKPQKNKETLVRMMAEAYTVFATGLNYKPAICFFKNSLQCKDFCNPIIHNKPDFQYLLKKIAVFYITTKQVGNIIEFEIHNNATEPLY